MDNLFTLILIGAVLFFMFRKGGFGCCGSHGHGNHGGHDLKDFRAMHSDHAESHGRQPEIIDLSKDDYQIISSDEKEI